MTSVQKSIVEGRFPEFIRDFFRVRHPDGRYPEWAVDALRKVNVSLDLPGGKETERTENGNTNIASREIKS